MSAECSSYCRWVCLHVAVGQAKEHSLQYPFHSCDVQQKTPLLLQLPACPLLQQATFAKPFREVCTTTDAVDGSTLAGEYLERQVCYYSGSTSQ